MKKKLRFLLILFCIGSLGINATAQEKSITLAGIEIEAENFTFKNEVDDVYSWEIVGDTLIPGMSNELAIQASPGDSVNNYKDDYETLAPSVSYEVNFEETGTYYFYFRANTFASGDKNSCHFGVSDGTDTTTFTRVEFDDDIDTWHWSNELKSGDIVSYEVTTPGKYELIIWVREIGTVIDKFMVSGEKDLPSITLAGAEIEAEDFTFTTEVDDVYSWEIVGDTLAPGMSNGLAIQASPGDSVNSYKDDYETQAPSVNYAVNFEEAGTYYFFFRANSLASPNKNSSHFGVSDGTDTTTFTRVEFDDDIDTWHWGNETKDGDRVSYEVTTPGLHELTIWVREIGTVIDKILVTGEKDLVVNAIGVSLDQSTADEDEETVDHDPNANFEPGVPVRVGPENSNSTFSYYNTTPESPDGSLICYVKILTTQRNRYTNLKGELWTCNADLTGHKMIVELNNFQVHNGVNAQWVDNNTIAYFDDGYIKVVNLKGEEQVPAIRAFSIGHAPHDNKILYSHISEETNYYTIYEYDISNGEKTEIADASTFKDIVTHFSSVDFWEMTNWKIRHLIYSPDGSKIALRMDVRPDGQKKPHLVTMNKSGGDIHFFGPKPMHFAWYDNESIMGHDNQINDRKTNDKSARRWSREAEFIETLAGPGNHLAASVNRELFASESWYGKDPVVLKIFKKGETKQFWFDYVGDDITVWELGNHVNPSFSRDGKRVYYHKSVGPGQSQAWMVVIPEIPSVTVDVGSTVQLTATVAPENATDKSVTWSSSAEAVATVDANGVVTGVSAGTATITVTTSDGGLTATAEITVNGATTVDLDKSVNFNVYPNPVKDHLFIVGEQINIVEIISVTGKTVMVVEEVGTEGINVSNIEQGIYLLKISTGKGTAVKSIVKE